MHHDAHNSATIAEDATIASKRQAAIEAREQALQAKADAVRAKAQFKAEAIRAKAEEKARHKLAKAENRALKIEGIAPAEVERKIRLDVHGRPKPLMRGWIHAIAAPLSLAAGIVLICLAHGASLKWACAVFMTASLILFTNSACYHLGDWSPRVTDVLRRIDHVNIFLLIAGTYTPVSFALEPFWRNVIIISMWACTAIAIVIHVIWINAPRWLYTVVYIIFGIYGLMGAGRTETMRLICGADPMDSGTIRVNGKDVKIRSPKDAVRYGIRGGAAVRRRCLLHPRRHRLRLAQARPLASRLRIP